MLPRWITAFYLVYLAIPIALLVVGSFGDLWLNTLLPTGFTLQWYADVAADPSFRRAFVASLAVAAIACAACVAIGLPLAYAIFRARSAAVRCAGARPLPVAGRAAAAGAGVRLHPGVLVGHAAVARQHLAACRRPRRARACPISCRPSSPTCSGSASTRWRTPRSRWAAAAGSASARRAAVAAAFDSRRPHHRRRAVARRIPVLEPRRRISQSHVSGRAAAGVLRRYRLRLRGDGRSCSLLALAAAVSGGVVSGGAGDASGGRVSERRSERASARQV